jgi:bacterial/archaeal transporter family-2 protein
MQSKILFIIMALALGAVLPIQAAINARLAKSLGSPMTAAFVSFLVGTLGLLFFVLAARQISLQDFVLQSRPWWIWTGGLLGIFFVSGIVVVLARLGTVLSFSLVLGGQMLAAIIIDQYGWLGVSIREISWGRMAGVILLIIGVVLIRKY